MAKPIYQSATRNFLDLPQETLVDILSHLNYDDLCVSMQVCRSLRVAVTDTPSLAYKLCLERNGMRNNRYSDRPLQERLANIREYERKWRTLDWSTVTHIHVPRTHRWSHSQTVVFSHLLENLVEQSAPVVFKFIRLPSPLRGVAMPEWDYPLPASYAHPHIMVDPSNDLILASNRPSDVLTHVHLLQLSTGVDHPNAAHSILRFEERVVLSRHPEALGTNLLLEYVPMPQRLINTTISDWTQLSGDKLMNLSQDFKAFSYTFLNASTVAALSYPVPKQSSISIYSRRTEPGSPPHFELSGSFMLPHLFLSDENIPSLRCAPKSSSDPFMLVGDFHPDGEDVLLAIAIGPRISHRNEGYVNILVRSSSLLTLSRIRSQPFNIPWEEWGPTNTHGLLYNAMRSLIPLYGLRAIPKNRPFKHDDGKWAFEVHDYHPRRISAALAFAVQIPESERNWRIVFGEEVHLPWSEEKKSLITQLPYIVTQQFIPDEMVGDDPGRLSVTFAEDGLIIQQDTYSSTPNLRRRFPVDIQVLSF